MKRKDWHIHTVVSDGDEVPQTMVALASQLGLESISITDHDAIDGYRLLTSAGTAPLEVVPGLELDCTYGSISIEILGYYLDVENTALCQYLSWVQGERFARAHRYIAEINRHFGRTVLEEQEVFAPERRTILKPHILRPLISKGVFPSYGEAKRFINALTDEGYRKKTAGEAIVLIQEAGGISVLAHPGVYQLEMHQVTEMIDTLKDLGIDGLETYYPYHSQVPERYLTADAEHSFIQAMEEKGKSLDLLLTRGTDSHTKTAFLELNSRSS
ncbi:MAG: PHP domain-containing protein [Vulcanimicrobiota bacterium]